MKLQGRVALVTGAGTGIGRAIAEAFAREGAQVAVNYSRSRDAAEEVVTAIRSAGGTATPIAADVSQQSDVDSMLDRVRQEFGGLDFLVNNAGWSTRIPHAHLDDLTHPSWDLTFQTTLPGTVFFVAA